MALRIALVAVLAFLTWCNAYCEEAEVLRPSIHGTVTGPDGKPIEGVRVDVSTAAPKVGRGIFCPSCYLDCGKWATTDKSGQFSIKDVDSSLKFRLVATKPGHRTLQTQLIDPSSGSQSLALDELPKDMDPSRVISGLVTQKGIPVAGALIEPHGAKTATKRWWGRVDGVQPAVTNANGYFAIVLPKDFLAVDIKVTGHGFCGEQLALLEPGNKPQPIEVRSGANVIGRIVIDGKPVAGMSIAVVQLERGTSDGIFIAAVGDTTDEEGRFEFRHLPPDQRYCIYSLVGEAKHSNSTHVLTTKTFSVPATEETRDLGSLEAELPCSIRGRLKHIGDKPLPKDLKISFGRDPAWDLIGVPVGEDGSFEVTGLPSETYEIRVSNRGLAVVAEQVNYQMLSEASFGLRLRQSVDNLVIPVKGKK